MRANGERENERAMQRVMPARPNPKRGSDETKVSVCMAVYNGADFLIPQIESILNQRRPVDELLIVDDASHDQTPSILCHVRDSRVRVQRNVRNMGVLAAFERALRSSSGSIVFLSDQDDVWFLQKVDAVMSVFCNNPDVTLVVTDASVIDEKGTKVSDSFYSIRGNFTGGVVHNLIKNKYLGCTMAFRRRMLDYFLPIPADVPMHDMWFGLLNKLYGKVYFINEPLMAYRRHDRNASPSKRASLGTMMSWRWRLVRNITGRIIHHATKRRIGEGFGTK
jgi:glycosyltransferase involved in cell wall biosynthesis